MTHSHLIDAFTIIGMIVSFFSTFAAVGLIFAWLLDKVVSAMLRTIGWLGPVTRFLRLSYQEKLRLKEDFQREKRKWQESWKDRL